MQASCPEETKGSVRPPPSPGLGVVVLVLVVVIVQGGSGPCFAMGKWDEQWAKHRKQRRTT